MTHIRRVNAEQNFVQDRIFFRFQLIDKAEINSTFGISHASIMFFVSLQFSVVVSSSLLALAETLRSTMLDFRMSRHFLWSCLGRWICGGRSWTDRVRISAPSSSKCPKPSARTKEFSLWSCFFVMLPLVVGAAALVEEEEAVIISSSWIPAGSSPWWGSWTSVRFGIATGWTGWLWCPPFGLSVWCWSQWAWIAPLMGNGPWLWRWPTANKIGKFNINVYFNSTLLEST